MKYSKNSSLAKQQRCLIHISRNLASKVKRSDRAVILEQFKTIYRAENLEMAVQTLEDFIAKWKPKYRKVMESLEHTNNLLNFYQFPYQIWHSMYSTNLIESLNKDIKRQTKKKALIPNEEALERYLVTLFEDYNFKQSQQIHKGFGQCSDTLESLFDYNSVTLLECLHIIIDSILLQFLTYMILVYMIIIKQSNHTYQFALRLFLQQYEYQLHVENYMIQMQVSVTEVVA